MNTLGGIKMNTESNNQICTKCKKTLPVDQFNKNRTTKTGLMYMCKSCHRLTSNTFNRNRQKRAREFKNSQEYLTGTKTCNFCGLEKRFCEFYSNTCNNNFTSTICKDCDLERAREYGKTFDGKIHALLAMSKFRAAKKKIAFNLDADYIKSIWTDTCPVLGIPLSRNISKSKKDDSPTLDKIIPTEGYVKGNVMIISGKANRIKTDASVDEICKVAEFYKNLLLSNT